ncbi:protein rep [uncultured Clostridium sp.]|uniref:protein rep n=1 Tax=uncultured Clostridium sp. TaxID=59620 RepID=UPI000821326D|nr:protein rep [uncultured Clostridium sp.]SCJ91056.1 Replication protein [uncultured Clostridium sp.]
MNNNIKKSEKNQQTKNNILQKCTSKKLKNPKFTSYIAPFISKTGKERCESCGDLTIFLADFEMKNKKLHKASFCGNRFCPMCSWRMSCKDSLKISILMEHLRKEENKEFIFLTLTAPNVKEDKLEEEIKHYNKSFKKLMGRKEVKSIVKGYIRKLEVTYNSDMSSKSYDTYHPHFHVVIAVNKTYFKKSDLYINQQRWLELWQEATGNSSITQVDVRKSKSNNLKEVYELAKYSAKDTDYLVSRPVFNVFYRALKGKQFIVFSGLFKDANTMYENGELDCYKVRDEIEYVYMMCYQWKKREYENTSIRELTEEERKQFNKDLLYVIEVD